MAKAKNQTNGSGNPTTNLSGGSSEVRRKAIDLAVSTIEKQFGKGSIQTMDGDGIAQDVDAISSGSPSLDIALGIGGYPRGRVVEIYGPESSGKTTLTLHAVAEAQKAGGVCAFIDAEHALDVGYARKLGVNVEDLLVSQPDTGEQALEIADVLIKSGAIDLVVVDSVAALVPRAEIEGEMGDTHVGLQARLMSQALRKLTGTLSKSGTTIMFINQIRMKIGVMFGNPETTSGGNALKFYSSVRLDVRRIGAIKDGDAVVGNRTRVKVVKNKCAPPFRQAEFDILYNEGVSLEGDLLDLAVESDIVEKSGSWFSYGSERIGQGRENARRFLKENKDIAATVAEKVFAERGLKRLVPAAEEAAAGQGAEAPAEASAAAEACAPNAWQGRPGPAAPARPDAPTGRSCPVILSGFPPWIPDGRPVGPVGVARCLLFPRSNPREGSDAVEPMDRSSGGGVVRAGDGAGLCGPGGAAGGERRGRGLRSGRDSERGPGRGRRNRRRRDGPRAVAGVGCRAGRGAGDARDSVTRHARGGGARYARRGGALALGRLARAARTLGAPPVRCTVGGRSDPGLPQGPAKSAQPDRAACRCDAGSWEATMQRRARRGFLAGSVMMALALGAGLDGRAAEAPVEEPDPATVKAEKLERLNRRIDRARAVGSEPAEAGSETDAQPPASASDAAPWSERLAAAQQRLEAARERLAAANAAYARARHDR
ncbi:MAG: recombinase RecA, partial [Myxococcales bacterium]|nr:recombinase RecA [Myxococcales bacterium]